MSCSVGVSTSSTLCTTRSPLLHEALDGLLSSLRWQHLKAAPVLWIEHAFDIAVLLQPIEHAGERAQADALEFLRDGFDHQGTARLHPQEKNAHILWMAAFHLLLKVPLPFVDHAPQKEDEFEQGRRHLLLVRKRCAFHVPLDTQQHAAHILMSWLPHDFIMKILYLTRRHLSSPTSRRGVNAFPERMFQRLGGNEL